MTVLSILQYPDPRLRIKAKTVEDFGSEIQKIIDDMYETLYISENCAALAATQLGIHYCITVIDLSEKKDQPLCLVNPEIVSREGKQLELEGCMSVAGKIYERVHRAEKITVKAQDRHGKPISMSVEGFMAKCIQHEVDHLHGTLFIDHLSLVKRLRIDKKVAKVQREKQRRASE
jgi:peptide deformylase